MDGFPRSSLDSVAGALSGKRIELAYVQAVVAAAVLSDA